MKKTLFLFVLLLSGLPHAYAQLQEAVEIRNEGLKLQKAQKFDEAIQKYKTAIQLDPRYATPHNDLGILYEERKQPNLAIQEYLSALNIDSNYTGVYTNLASLYESQGDVQNALTYWDKRSQMGDPNDPWRAQAAEKASQLRTLLDPGATGAGKSYSVPDADDASQATSLEKQNKKRIKVLISEAKDAMTEHRYAVALEKLNEAKSLGGDEKSLENLIRTARENQIHYDLARAEMEVDLYKQAKLIEVENAWYPPVPESDAGKTALKDLSTLSAKSEARRELEAKARQKIPSIDFDDARLKDVVEYLALSNEINIVIDEQVVDQATGVTIHLKDIPLIEALDIILRTKGLKYRFEDNIIWITTADKLAEEELTVKVYDVQDLVGKLHDFPSKPFDVEDIIKKESGTTEA